MASLVWRCLSCWVPSYLRELCRPLSLCTGHCTLRSSALGNLVVPFVRSATMQTRSFSSRSKAPPKWCLFSFPPPSQDFSAWPWSWAPLSRYLEGVLYKFWLIEWLIDWDTLLIFRLLWEEGLWVWKVGKNGDVLRHVRYAADAVWCFCLIAAGKLGVSHSQTDAVSGWWYSTSRLPGYSCAAGILHVSLCPSFRKVWNV